MTTIEINRLNYVRYFTNFKLKTLDTIRSYIYIL